jgi:preprotein translocase subunit SecG
VRGFGRRADQLAAEHENAMTTNSLTVLGRFTAIMITAFFIAWVLKGCPH